jgi:DNA-binding response OmpR family regulator
VHPMTYRVIIVEDHEESAEGLAELMAIWGYEPHVATDGERALELLEAVAPHVVISDIGLPGMDGHELARRIRSVPGGASILLIALTGASDRKTLADSNFDHTLVKPVELDVLERLLENETRRSVAS